MNIHALVNEESAPIAVTIGKGSEHEGRRVADPSYEVNSIRHGKGRPRKNPRLIHGDTKYIQHGPQQVLP